MNVHVRQLILLCCKAMTRELQHMHGNNCDNRDISPVMHEYSSNEEYIRVSHRPRSEFHDLSKKTTEASCALIEAAARECPQYIDCKQGRRKISRMSAGSFPVGGPVMATALRGLGCET